MVENYVTSVIWEDNIILGKIGLFILAIIQISTAVTIFSASKKDEMLGMKILQLKVYYE